LAPKTPTEARKTFKTYELGFVPVDVKYLPQMADETTRRDLFVSIDRATRWVSGVDPVSEFLDGFRGSGLARFSLVRPGSWCGRVVGVATGTEVWLRG
jgi:hypothetical protein